MKKSILIIIVLFQIIPFSSRGQKNVQVAANLFVSAPLAEFKENLESEQLFLGLGLKMTFPFSENNSLLRYGFDFRYSWYGSSTVNFEFVDDFGYTYDVEFKARTSMIPFMAAMRIDPMYEVDFPVMPYGGFFAGFSVSPTRIILSTYDPPDSNNPYVDKYFGSLNFTAVYGFEVGLHIRIKRDMLLDFRYERNYSTPTKYADLSTLVVDQDLNYSYDKFKSKIIIQNYFLGLVFEIND